MLSIVRSMSAATPAPVGASSPKRGYLGAMNFATRAHAALDRPCPLRRSRFVPLHPATSASTSASTPPPIGAYGALDTRPSEDLSHGGSADPARPRTRFGRLAVRRAAAGLSRRRVTSRAWGARRSRATGTWPTTGPTIRATSWRAWRSASTWFPATSQRAGWHAPSNECWGLMLMASLSQVAALTTSRTAGALPANRAAQGNETLRAARRAIRNFLWLCCT